MYLLPVEKVASSTRIAADAAESIFGTGGGGIMAALVIISTFSAVNGVILSGPRVYFAMTRDRLLFKWMGAIHPRFRTPARAILLQAVWAAVLILTGTYRELFTRVVYIEWLFFGFMAIGLISLTRNRGFKKDYNRGGGLIIPVIFSIFSFAIVINQVITDPAESLTGLLLVFAGIPVFYIWLKKPKKI
jgi:APA family basic amino acid/polyamine antiporter